MTEKIKDGGVAGINGMLEAEDVAKISLDQIIDTMWDTAKDMSTKYKETSEGGLAIQVNWSDC